MDFCALWLVYYRCENGSWFDHVLEWWEASKADPEHVLFLRYEDMVADATSTVKTIAEFVGIETSPELIQKVNVVEEIGRGYPPEVVCGRSMWPS